MKRLSLLKSMLLLCALMVGSSVTWAQDATVLFHETFGNNSSSAREWNDSYSVKSGVKAVYSGIEGYTVVNAKQGKNTTGSTASGLNQSQSGKDASIVIGPLNVADYSTLKLTYQWKATSIKETYTTSAYYATSSTGEYTEVSGTGDGATTFVERAYSLPVAAQVSTLYLKIVFNTSNTQAIIDEVELTGVNDNRVAVATIGDLGITTLDYNAEGKFAPAITPADGLTASDYTVAWEEVDNDQLLLTEDGEYVAGTTKGDVNVTVSVTPTAENSATHKAVSKTFAITIVNPNAGNGTAAKPFTPSELIEAYEADELTAGTEYYVKGIISSIASFDKGAITYRVSDDGTETDELKIQKGKNINGADFESIDDLKLGDIVTVKGNYYENMGGTPYLDNNNEIVELKRRTAVNITSFEADETSIVIGNTTSTTVANNVPGWTASYTYSSSNEDVATVDAKGQITAIAKGSATITVAPNIAVDDEDYKAGTALTVDITVTNEFHNVIFSVNGVASSPVAVEEGENIEFPTDVPSNLGGKTFVGWATEEIAGTQVEAPSTLVTSAVMGDADMTYFAVYATGNLATVTDVLDNEFTGVSGTSYTEWSGKTSVSSAVYAGQSAGSNNSIQLRSKNNNSGIVTTASGGNVKKIVVEWNSSTSSERTLDIYGNSTAYSDATDLYNDDDKGTKLGSIACGTSTELTVDGDYAFIGMRSNDGAMYIDKISIFWESGSATDYCTTVTVSKDVTEYGWASYVAPYNVEFPASRAYVVTSVTGKQVNTAEVTSVPANTAVLLKGEGTVTATVLTEAPEAPAQNMLEVSDGTIAAGKYAYVLAKNDKNKAGFKRWTGDAATLNGRVVMLLDQAVASAHAFYSLDEESTGIGATLNDNVEMTNDKPVYNLAGQRVRKPSKGLYIVNGKKIALR